MADGTINIDTQINSNGIDRGLQEIETKLGNLGGSIKGIGESLTASVSAPLIALGTAAMKVASDFESSNAKIQNSFGLTSAEAEALGDTVKNVYKDGFGESLDDVTNSLIKVKQNLKGLNEGELEQATKSAMTLAQTFDADVNEVTRAGGNIMKAFGVDSTEAFDLMAAGAQKGLNFSDEMFDNISEYAPLWAEMGYSAEEMFNILANGGDAAVYNLDYMNDIMKEFQIRIKDGSKSTTDAMGEMSASTQKVWKEMLAGKKTIAEVADTIVPELKAMDDQVKANELGVALFGTKWEDLESTAVYAMFESKNALGDYEGAMGKMVETQEQTFGQRFQSLLREATTALQPLGNVLLDLATAVMPHISKAIQFLSEKFSGLSPATQLAVTAIGILVAALGPLLMLTGALITSVGTVAGALAGISAPILAAVAVITALGTTLAASYMHFEGFRSKVMEVFNTVSALLSTALSSIVSFVQEQLAKIQQFWSENGQQIMQAVQNLADFLIAVFEFCMPAIQFIVEYVWNAVKSVISGAIDIILGVIKTFSSLLTGDWSGMWEGIKQIVSGAISLILGWLTLTFVGGIRTLFTNLAKAGLSLLKGMWDDIAKVFTSMGSKASALVDKMVQTVVSYFYGLLTKAKSIYGTLKTFGASTWEAIKQATINVVTTMVNNVKTLFANKLTAIKNTMNQVKTTITNLWDKAVAYLKGINLVQIGKDIISGLVKGIADSIRNVTDAIGEIAGSIPKWAKKILGIHSPSRVMRELGEWTGIGLAEGIESTEKLNQKMMKSVTDSILAIRKNYKNESVKIDSDLAKNIKSINEKAHENIAKIQKAAASKKRALTLEENSKVQKIRKDAIASIQKLEEKAVADRSKLAVNEKKAIEGHYKTLLEDIKAFVSDKKSLNQLSLKDEVDLWEQSLVLFKGSTDQRIAAQKAYRDALQALNAEITSINQNYLQKINDTNENYLRKEEEITKAYEDAVNKRATSLSGFASMFDAYNIQVEKTGIDLINNLQSQVYALNQWRYQFEALSKRGVLGEELLDEISEMGVRALPELIELNKLTDEQLTHYSNLYKEKMRSAREQAEKELAPDKSGMELMLKMMREKAGTELKKLEDEWAEAIRGVTKVTESELNSLEDIGVQAGRGLLEGLSSMAGPLAKKAQEIAKTISSTIADALKIKSPSRVMMEIGQWTGEGLVIGIDDSAKDVLYAAKNLASNILNPVANIPDLSFKMGQQVANVNVNTAVSAAPVIMDGQKVGEIVFNPVSQKQQQAASVNAFSKGVNLWA